MNTGIYIIEPEILDKIPKNEKFDFSKDLFPLLMSEGEKLYGYIADGYWCDIGDAEQYMQAQIDILDGKVIIDINAQRQANNIYLQEDVVIEHGAIIQGLCFIGSGTRIACGARIQAYTILGANCLLGNVNIKKSILWDSVHCSCGVNLRGAIICARTRLGINCNVYENVIVGEIQILRMT